MSEKNKKIVGGSSKEPGRVNGSTPTVTAKKTAPHRKVIEDAANFNFDNTSSNNQSSSSNVTSEDYELGKVSRSKKESYHEEVSMVKDLDRWG